MVGNITTVSPGTTVQAACAEQGTSFGTFYLNSWVTMDSSPPFEGDQTAVTCKRLFISSNGVEVCRPTDQSPKIQIRDWTGVDVDQD